jgi:hypothetical protein
MDALRDAHEDDPALLEEVYVFAYDDDGSPCGEAIRGDEALARDTRAAPIYYWTGRETEAAGKAIVVPSTKVYGYPRQRLVAKS